MILYEVIGRISAHWNKAPIVLGSMPDVHVILTVTSLDDALETAYLFLQTYYPDYWRQERSQYVLKDSVGGMAVPVWIRENAPRMHPVEIPPFIARRYDNQAQLDRAQSFYDEFLKHLDYLQWRLTEQA